ncbi:hypothetical protein HNR02_000921 [Amycolatopsis endophytica]|uniref:Uncharacterized protein n=1 Tax=Amycolatopsis endophytica TaxID=860233 RepID=A0A853AY07_9PSEU|nr:hypothetical protein [Amycolatopsis endophytica]NYI87598.1 hypothetical protein [Amycolatopsis endophytica]
MTAVLAAVVALSALVTVRLLREDGGSAPTSADGAAGSAPTAGVNCGEAPCRVIAQASVDGALVELLADAQGGNGRFQAGGNLLEVTVSALGGRLDAGSLSCVDGAVSACLVHARQNGAMIAQLVVDRAGTWRSVDKPYYSSAGVVRLDDVSGDSAPEVVVVQTAPVLARVFALDGSALGCTRQYTSVGQLRGWPEVQVRSSDLRGCS